MLDLLDLRKEVRSDRGLVGLADGDQVGVTVD